jgi:Domain of unknown function (4846)
MRLYLAFLLVLCSCVPKSNDKTIIESKTASSPIYFAKIEEIPVPDGFTRLPFAPHSFENFLRQLGLKKDKTVFLYNGEKKRNQLAQFAVVDISRSKTDLQQCADVVMRLRAEYLFTERKFDSIRFMDYNKKWYIWNGAGNRDRFDAYLNQVFGYCGSASLEKQLKKAKSFSEIKTGDVLIKGGFPGHAMIVADMAMNKKGEKIFLLLQGYQPAQDAHVLINPGDLQLSPWYRIPEGNEIRTPEWNFKKDQLYVW